MNRVVRQFSEKFPLYYRISMRFGIFDRDSSMNWTSWFPIEGEVSIWSAKGGGRAYLYIHVVCFDGICAEWRGSEQRERRISSIVVSCHLQTRFTFIVAHIVLLCLRIVITCLRCWRGHVSLTVVFTSMWRKKANVKANKLCILRDTIQCILPSHSRFQLTQT